MRRNTLTDFDGSKDFAIKSTQYHAQKNPIFELVSSFLKALLGGIPLSYRLILQKDIGILLLTPFSIVTGSIWVLIVFGVDGVSGSIDYPDHIFGVSSTSLLYRPLSFFWFIISLPFQAIFNTNGLSAEERLKVIGLILSITVFVRGFFMLNWSLPKKVREEPDYNPLDLGQFWWDKNESRIRKFLIFWNVPTYSYNRLYAHVEMVVWGVLIAFLGAVFYWSEKQFLSDIAYVFYGCSKFLILGGIFAARDGRRRKKDLLNARIMKLANQAWAREQITEYGERKQQEAKTRKTVSYGGKV